MKILSNPDRESWLKCRRPNINSTDSAALFSASPYLSEFQLYHLKKGNIEDSFAESERTIIGQEVEAGIAAAFGRMNDMEVRPFKDYLYDEDARIGSSFDFEIMSGKYEGWLLEIKNVDYIVYRDEWLEHEAPPHIEIQVQHEAMVADRPGVIVCACVGGNSLKWFPRESNPEMSAAIKKRIQKFWEDFHGNVEPEPNYQKDIDALSQIYSKATAGKLHDANGDEEILAMLENHRRWGIEIKRLEAMQDSARAEILAKVNDASKIVCGEYSVSCGVTKDSAPTLITEDMVGQTYGGRKGYRMFRVNKKIQKEEK